MSELMIIATHRFGGAMMIAGIDARGLASPAPSARSESEIYCNRGERFDENHRMLWRMFIKMMAE
jgi:hypothetical protein